MRQILILLLLTTIALATEVRFEYYTGLEDQQALPTGAEAAIRPIEADAMGTCESYEGVAIDLNGDGEARDYIVRGYGGCAAASAEPVYIVQHRYKNVYRVVLSFMTSSVDILTTEHNGMPDIKTSRGTASMYECEFWHFNGTEYDTVDTYSISAYDGNTCKKYPGICPWKCD